MRVICRTCAVVAGFWLLLHQCQSSGLDTVVVVNQARADSVALGNLYCELRRVPPQNLLRITNWTGGQVEWSAQDFTNCLLRPLQQMLTERALTNQVKYVVLSMGFPYRVWNASGLSSGTNSTTSALFYGFKPDDCAPGCPDPASCALPASSANAYAGSEMPFRAVSQFGNLTNSFIASMITATNLAEAVRFVERAAAADSTFPTQKVYLAKSTDPARRIRHVLFDNAIFENWVLGRCNVVRTNSNGLTQLVPAFGFQGGVYRLTVPTNAFEPGAIADTLTSYSGRIFVWNDHTTVLDFLLGGAALSYGTVVEPCAYLGKFPTPNVYFYLARGFTAGEAYYMSITNPYQGLIVGDPLVAPFATHAQIVCLAPAPSAVLTGTTNIKLQIATDSTARPVGRVDVFVDGRWFNTITNIGPAQGNRLSVTINGYTTTYNVPAGATIKGVAEGLANSINSPAFSNQTKVKATPVGDRIRLQGTARSVLGTNITLATSNYVGTGSRLSTYLTAAQPRFLDSPACGQRRFTVEGTLALNAYLNLTVVKTNGSVVRVGCTNTGPFTDIYALTAALTNMINVHPELTGPDGVAAEDLAQDQSLLTRVEFVLRARSTGWQAAAITAELEAGGGLIVTPLGPQTLEENLEDLQPRNHLYVSAGQTNLTLEFTLNTTQIPDGYHLLSFVSYEGTHVQTPTRLDLPVVVSNTSLAAVMTCTPCASNTALETTITFTVVANTNQISRIELHGTGGLISTASNQSTGVFTVVGTNFGPGLHQFWAVVTRTDGKQYRTEPKFIRLVTDKPPFQVNASGFPPVLTWPAVAGRQYQILRAESLTNEFEVTDTVVPQTGTGVWTETNAATPTMFYRIRSVP